MAYTIDVTTNLYTVTSVSTSSNVVVTAPATPVFTITNAVSNFTITNTVNTVTMYSNAVELKVDDFNNYFKGDWQSGATYRRGDIVNYDLSLYTCNTGTLTTLVSVIPPVQALGNTGVADSVGNRNGNWRRVVFNEAVRDHFTITNHLDVGGTSRFVGRVDMDTPMTNLEVDTLLTANRINAQSIYVNTLTTYQNSNFYGSVDFYGNVNFQIGSNLQVYDLTSSGTIYANNIDVDNLKLNSSYVELGDNSKVEINNTFGQTPYRLGVAIGSGSYSTSSQGVAVGAVSSATGQNSVAIGFNAHATPSYGISIGQSAGTNVSGFGSDNQSKISIGYQAGQLGGTYIPGAYPITNGLGAVAIGERSGSAQSAAAVAIGYQAGAVHYALGGQGYGNIAIGYQAAYFPTTSTSQLWHAQQTIAIGLAAGYNGQKDGAIAIGYNAGGGNIYSGGFQRNSAKQGQNSIAIGYQAAAEVQSTSSIVLNATGAILNAYSSGTFIAPLRELTSDYAMYYNPTTKETTYNNKLNLNFGSIVN